MRTMALRVFALVVCLLALPLLAAADDNDTYLSTDDAVHVDFTLGLALHADAFPQSSTHLKDWETFLSKLSLRGSLDGQAFITPVSRVYLNAALQVNGEDTIPFVYDGYHSYRYLVSPMFMNDTIHFQMHNFFDFMLKPWYFMELPTQYIALLLYPNATYYLADSYYTPVKEMIDEARQDALDGAADEDVYLDGDAEVPAQEEETGDGELTYVIPYERLFELCEGLDYITTDDEGYYRVYYYFDTLLAELYASEMMTDTLSNLETILDELDPDEEGMTVTESADGMVCEIGGNEVFTKTVTDTVTQISLRLPIPLDYELAFDYRRENTGDANEITALASVSYEGDLAVSLSLTGEGLPAEGALSGNGSVTAQMDGYVFEEVPAPLTLTFDWSRTAAELPFDLDLNVQWIHPETGLPAVSAAFSGAFSARDKSVFTEVNYEQNDFFNLNDSMLQEYKQRWTPTIGLYLLPVVMEMPSGVVDDIVNFMLDKDILISLME
jgi:hypothetical protein